MAAGAMTTYLPGPVEEYVISPRIRVQSAALEIARGLTDRAADPLDSKEPVAIRILLTLKRPGALCGGEPSIERRWLGCTPRSPEVRERLQVYAAVAARNARAMLERARSLLAEPAKEGDWGRYLLVTAILGAHATGEHEEARRLWETYGSKLYPDGDIPPYVVYLVSLS